LAEEPQYILGCPVTREGHDLISRTGYNKLNAECAAGKCVCVLSADPDDGESQEVIKIPSVVGTPKALTPRFFMPNLDDKFVSEVLGGKKDKGYSFSPEPLMMDPKMWHQNFPKMKANMQKIMDHFNKEMTNVERDVTAAYRAWEKEQDANTVLKALKVGDRIRAKEAFETDGKGKEVREILRKDAGTVKKVNADGSVLVDFDDIEKEQLISKSSYSKLEKDDSRKQIALETKAADVFEQYHSFQTVCSKMEQNAQRMGLADNGEAKDLNCHLDPKEKEEAYKAMDVLTEMIQKRHEAENAPPPPPPTQSCAPIDQWVAGPLAAAMQIPCGHHLHLGSSRHRKSSHSGCRRRIPRDRAWRQEASDFLASAGKAF
jgi:hypothetical protein